MKGGTEPIVHKGVNLLSHTSDIFVPTENDLIEIVLSGMKRKKKKDQGCCPAGYPVRDGLDG